jgi:1-acyl-sn-glycerol-3-phosphate acyltransferase
MKKVIYQFIFFRLMGWKIEGTLSPEIKKCVFMVMPHTSWHDFYLGLFTRGIVQLEMNWVGKKELFAFPFGAYFCWMGGAPLDRRGNKNLVESIISIFENREIFRMAIAPEGTRNKVEQMKSGFYYIAIGAKVPIIPVAFDFGTKTVKFGQSFFPTGNYQEDMNHILQFFKGVKGKFPKKQFNF